MFRNGGDMGLGLLKSEIREIYYTHTVKLHGMIKGPEERWEIVSAWSRYSLGWLCRVSPQLQTKGFQQIPTLLWIPVKYTLKQMSTVELQVENRYFILHFRSREKGYDRQEQYLFIILIPLSMGKVNIGRPRNTLQGTNSSRLLSLHEWPHSWLCF